MDSFDGSRNKEISVTSMKHHFGLGFLKEVEDITLPDDVLLRSLFAENGFLPATIHFARRELNKRFGPDAPMTLQGRIDPEEGDRYATLVVQAALDPGEATARRDAFDEAWWYDRSDPRLVINFELV